jgi:FtsP/CotA-like multicopper oxidase with cupredoxin domain
LRAQPQAAADARTFRNPPVLGQAAPREGAAPLAARAAEGVSPAGRERFLDLNIVYSDNFIYNPATGVRDPVHLRSYKGTDMDPKAPFVAPTIEVTPGDTVRISLNNKLPADPSCNDPKAPINTPHCFNGTNLHSHGLWVSPTGNSDNVLLSINPGVSFQYEYNIPQDHPSGTFWYHTHRHGSTALQVASGMAGALIIRGARKPSTTANGDIDTLLMRPNGTPFPERILLFQQIQYACVGPDGKIKWIDPNDHDKGIDWSCKPGEVGVVESYDQFGPGTWDASGRYTSINGMVLPVFRGSAAGQLERWRLVHGGVRDTISLEIRKLTKDIGPFEKLIVKQGDGDGAVAQACAGDALPYQVIASDGLTMDKAQKRSLLTLQPAYRHDLLVVFPQAGRYCIVDAAAEPAGSVGAVASGRQVIGFVEVGPGTAIANVDNFVVGELVKAAQKYMPAAVQAQVIADLKNGLRFGKFVPHPTVADGEVTGTQNLVFFIDVTSGKFEVGTTQDDLKPYDPVRIDRVLKLGDVQEWVLQSHFVSHPFHIHVNPFQVVKIIDPNGRDVSPPDAVDDAGGGTPDPQYPGLKGVWKDTLWVKSLNPKVKYPQGVYKIYVRTRYQRYIGEYVLHCHILDHEDQGMMQNVSIQMPDGRGGTVAAHH